MHDLREYFQGRASPDQRAQRGLLRPEVQDYPVVRLDRTSGADLLGRERKGHHPALTAKSEWLMATFT